ncbi:MAG: quinol:cytochrome C oxidoreductase [Bacteroidota bacterium]
MEQTFNFTKKTKTILFVFIAIGILSLVYGIVSHDIHGHRLWANVLLNNFYFLAIALAGVFFVVVHILGESGWHTSIQRIPEAMGTYLPFGSMLMLLILLGMHDLYHWTHTEELDAVLQDKTPYLNIPFFTIRTVVYLAGWTLLAYKLRQISLASDKDPSFDILKKSRSWAAFFVVFFAITSSTSAWDWLMSIDPHWFSTLYGWYIFSSFFVAGIAVIILIVIYLNKIGYLPHLNEEHLHDLGKYLFGFSIFWAYLWFSQFMLIWYANIPEETIYFVERVEHFSLLFYLNLGINFFIPFIVLMTRGSKRHKGIMVIAALIVFVGHWIDIYLAIMPGAVGHEEAGIGLLEVGLTIGYTGLFLFIVFTSLTKASLIPVNHPFYKESLEYDNI